MLILKSGVKLTSIVPGKARDKINDKLKDQGIDIDLNNLDSRALDEIVAGLGSMSIDVDDDNDKVRIFSGGCFMSRYDCFIMSDLESDDFYQIMFYRNFCIIG